MIPSLKASMQLSAWGWVSKKARGLRGKEAPNAGGADSESELELDTGFEAVGE